MDLGDLRAFIAVAEERNFTKAAKRLYTSQPPLSRQIRELEEEIGVTLFLRTNKGAELTEEGRLLLSTAQAICGQATEFLNTARRLQNRDAGLVKIGIAWRLWELVNRVRAQHAKRFPAVAIEGHDIFSGYQSEALRDHAIDVGFLRPPIDTTCLQGELIVQERFVVLINENNPLAKRPLLRLTDIADETLLLYARTGSTGLHDKILSLYASARVKPKITPITIGPAQEAGLIPIAAGQGIYLTTTNPLSSMFFGSGIAAIPLDEPDATFWVAVVWRKDERSRSILQFVDSVRGVFLPQGQLM